MRWQILEIIINMLLSKSSGTVKKPFYLFLLALCSFISGEASAQFEIFLGAVQFIVLLVYFLYLFRITARKREPALKGR